MRIFWERILTRRQINLLSIRPNRLLLLFLLIKTLGNMGHWVYKRFGNYKDCTLVQITLKVFNFGLKFCSCDEFDNVGD